ncbi:MAG: DUF3098 domain-containing protein [Saprospiraceae bacterium]|jgi:hypothetical protein
MSKQQGSKKKVVVTTTPQTSQRKAPVKPQSNRQADKPKGELIFKRHNFILLAVGAALMALGIALMSGGAMPDPNVWDEQIIYSPQRMVIAPLLMIAGLVVEIFAIFR